ncbi:hypothetical protein BAE44_0012766 [Dichanthelium oligosanthes]|uniref:Uncharacterized protein n=1 Tax=Dichanthelium oligosanthes TaxID=888268 RepID=A0A1E5VMD1_9POAL|nr:hypothetical protein BAE44_0012766 [Dichanthelium oligosanthes]
MVPSCLQSQGHGESLTAAGAEARHLTLEEILYPPPSWEAVEGTPARRNSPKVCPVSLHDGFSSDDNSEGGGYSPAGVNESTSVVSRASLRSQHSVSRRVSFRSPDESDVFIIPARRSDSDEEEEDDDESSDGEPSRV